MSNQLKKVILVIGILPATFLLLGTVIWLPLFITKDFTDLLITTCFLFGIAGYIGLWRHLLPRTEKKIKWNNIYLIAGIIGSIGFLFITKSSIAIDIKMGVYFLPTIVSVIILINSWQNGKPGQ